MSDSGKHLWVTDACTQYSDGQKLPHVVHVGDNIRSAHTLGSNISEGKVQSVAFHCVMDGIAFSFVLAAIAVVIGSRESGSRL